MNNQLAESKIALILLLSISILTGCKTSSEFNNSSFLQKRKYTKGFHVNGPLSAKQKSEGNKPTIDAGDEEITAEGLNQTETSAKAFTAPYEPIASNANSAETEIIQRVEDPVATNSVQTDPSDLGSEVFQAQPDNRVNTKKYKHSKYEPDIRKVPGLAIAGFICGIVGLFVAGIPLGILAVVFGAIALGKINKNPVLYKGKGFAIASLILGLGAIIGAAIVISAA